MPNKKTDNAGFSTKNSDQQRDNAAKGGPAAGTGIADSKHGAAKPYTEDTATQIAAKSNKKKEGATGNKQTGNKK